MNKFVAVPHICNLVCNLSFEINQVNADNIVDPRVKASGTSKKDYHIVIYGNTYKKCQENLVEFMTKFEEFMNKALKNDEERSSIVT